MRRETLYKIAIGVLLTVNIAQVSYLFLTKKPANHTKEHSKPNAIEILRLSEDQNIRFKAFSKQHHEAMVLLQEEQKKCVRDYFTRPSQALLDCVKDIEAKKIQITKKHFDDMKSVLKEEQLPYYEEFKDKALRYILR
ncbi:hypothetical protein [Maribacter sp. 2307UL18-2]|uniref:hypothetical protein n=1 Tax=Maribacter sp. 2307UL18-2 TaxID=3386274 RepID=UPI0039BD0314